MKIGNRHLIVILWAALSAGLLGGGVANAQVSPVGTWDFTVSGVKTGSAYLTFNNDNTITGYILVSPSAGSGKGTQQTPGFGYGTLNGQWQMNGNQVVGFLYNDPADTVRLDITSFSGTVANNLQSFKISGATVNGNLTLSGAPFVQYIPLPNTWTIEEQAQGQLIFTEVFSATPDQTTGGGNLYDLAGQGADICLSGYGALSRGNNFNIALTEYPMPASGDCSSIDPSNTTGTVSTGVGKLNLQSNRASLSGFQAGSPLVKVVMPVICADN